MYTKKNFFVIIPAILLWSCGSANRNPSDMAYSEDASAKMEAPVTGLSEQAPDRARDQAMTERKVIKTGDVRFETSSLTETHTKIIETLKKFNGYVSREGENNYGDRLEQNMEVRVPSDKFEVFLDEITAGVKRFDYKNIGTSDVTEEYIDVESRLNSKKELEKRYIEILSKAKTVTELLEIEKELNNVRSDIESMTGRLKYIQSQVAYSTLNINFYEVNAQPLGFGSKILQGFSNGWHYLLVFLIWLINLWPFILITAIVIWVAFRFAKRKQD